jgi:hypothetical protein
MIWPNPAYKPDCAACHANDFRRKEHLKTEKPSKVYYQVSELRDCSGACHLYKDNTFTVIKETKTGKHRPGKGDW